MRLDTVNEETAKDPTLTAVINAILSSDWQVKDKYVHTKTLRTLYLCRSELSLTHNASILLSQGQTHRPYRRISSSSQRQDEAEV